MITPETMVKVAEFTMIALVVVGVLMTISLALAMGTDMSKKRLRSESKDWLQDLSEHEFRNVEEIIRRNQNRDSVLMTEKDRANLNKELAKCLDAWCEVGYVQKDMRPATNHWNTMPVPHYRLIKSPDDK
jgi:hypothetical protein